MTCNCWKCKEGRPCIRTVTIAAAATPSRRPQAVKYSTRDKQWEKDHAAYRRLRKQGIQPGGLDNCAQMETMARTRYEIEAGVCMPANVPTKNLKARINAGHDISLANNVKPTVKAED